MVFINMYVKFDVFSLFVIENEKEDSVIGMIVSVWFIDFKDDLNDEEVCDFDVSLFLIIVFELKNDDEFEGRDIKIEEVNLEMVLGIGKGVDIKFDIIDDV